ncbi:hypothetical protein VRRI112168_00485 [Vreelandella rituensis]|uniref:Toprim domain-containing protein n=1 Tax=Vreelandella rituensis TaxID=2282306 RepID=A0A368UAY3_9GAMM|nr:hypothetical protein [Halomonas rituensis]RCV93826.1 hypothetical protein DU506_01325 [Halomonas rituensis]
MTQSTPYLDKKAIALADLQEYCTSRVFIKRDKILIFDDDNNAVDSHTGDFIFRELVDPLGASLGFERILDEKVQRSPSHKQADKFLTPGSSTSGFTPIGFDIKDMPRLSHAIIVCAGLADGFRLHEATGLPVACCVGEPSIGKVARAVHTATNFIGSPVEVIVAADNDKAGRAAAMRSGYPWTVPSEEKDWSDVYQAKGAHAVRTDFMSQHRPVFDDELEKALDILGVRHGVHQSNRAPINTLTFTDDPASFGGKRISLSIQSGADIPGFEQYLRLARAMGCHADLKQGNGIEACDVHAQTLVMSLLHGGLEEALSDSSLEAARQAKEHLLALANAGALDDAEAFVGPPMVVQRDPMADDAEISLLVHSEFDKTLIAAFKEARGRWDKDSKAWRFTAKTQGGLQHMVARLAALGEARMAFLPDPEQASLVPICVATPARVHELIALFERAALRLPERASTPAAPNPTPPAPDKAKAENSVAEACILERDGWPEVSIKLPYNLRDHKEALKKLDASFDGEQKVWRLPLSHEVLTSMKDMPIKWAGGTLSEARRALDAKGFGYFDSCGADRVRVVVPFNSRLVERIKEDLPPMARKFDRDSKAWEIHLATPAVINSLKRIGEDFDIRIRQNDGAILSAGKGWDSVGAHDKVTAAQAPAHAGQRQSAIAPGAM